MKIKIDRCPFCGSDRGFEVFTEMARNYHVYDFSGKTIDRGYNVESCFGEPAYCINCGKRISKKYIKVE